ncbi:MAG: hypothetical protein V4615_16690 [Bacteroidota bacterium]
MAQVLIHIGYPKAGSTYLHEWFTSHPCMLYNTHAISGFYHTHDLARYAESSSYIHDCFVLSNEDLSVWKGDVDIVGIKNARFYDVKNYQENLSETLHRIYPEAKVLIVTRGYTTYFQSLYSQYVSSGGALSFDDFKSKFGSVFPDAYDYTFIVSLYRKIFGSENVILLPFELLKDNPTEFTAAIEEQIGIKERFKYKTERVNASFDKKILFAYRRISSGLVKLVSPLPYSWQKMIYGFYIQCLNKKRPHPWMEILGKWMNTDIKMGGVEEILESLKGKSEILRNEKLYQPYLKEYLL